MQSLHPKCCPFPPLFGQPHGCRICTLSPALIYPPAPPALHLRRASAASGSPAAASPAPLPLRLIRPLFYPPPRATPRVQNLHPKCCPFPPLFGQPHGCRICTLSPALIYPPLSPALLLRWASAAFGRLSRSASATANPPLFYPPLRATPRVQNLHPKCCPFPPLFGQPHGRRICALSAALTYGAGAGASVLYGNTGAAATPQRGRSLRPSPCAPSPCAPASCGRLGASGAAAPLALRPPRSRWLRSSLASVFAASALPPLGFRSRPLLAFVLSSPCPCVRFSDSAFRYSAFRYSETKT